ncbi:hypothetical protein CVT24_003598 [Panaeolus cyanescens]|uniref:Diphthine--ammonia ligase n=1 Tax=Panaeolus cyanescens TaxID=181874 RepID=A0A409Y7U5_9AGAR|nr:hypothetical protein CVT24_003598 [Panaeolus cyanescens]
MKYVALLSGGKDSCYNLVHCAKNGHELVAAASLRPGPGKEELDSYLYQTVGQDAIEYVARALDVPLYRKVITGNAVEHGAEYGGRNVGNAGGVTGDETEDLFEILSLVKENHPDVQGVSVGAILSNYQRVRVEHVCKRLGWTPLSYLWQRNQDELLSEMIDSGMEAILIKVAGIGLKTNHLGKTLSEMKPTLHKLNTLYGLHVCGEGGEYESLTLDCPLFKSRIKLLETEVVIHSDHDFATVAFLRIKSAELEPKVGEPADITTPPLLEEKYQGIYDTVTELHGDCQRKTKPDSYRHLEVSSSPKVATFQRGSWVTVCNVEATAGHVTVEEDVKDCFDKILHKLSEHGLDISNCAMINILLESMDLFGRVNQVYGAYFGSSPAARACVGVNLPQGVRVRVECIAFKEVKPTDRQSLHVQGLSYWAPASIGPYSQAISVGEHIFISGQIGLIPSQLLLPSPQSLPMELALSSQHVNRVISAVKENHGGSWTGYEELVIYWLSDVCDIPPVKAGHLEMVCPKYLTYMVEVIKQTHLQTSPAPTIFAVVSELPKGALVEKQVVFHTGRSLVWDDEIQESSFLDCKPIREAGMSQIPCHFRHLILL